MVSSHHVQSGFGVYLSVHVRAHLHAHCGSYPWQMPVLQ